MVWRATLSAIRPSVTFPCAVCPDAPTHPFLRPRVARLTTGAPSCLSPKQLFRGCGGTNFTLSWFRNTPFFASAMAPYAWSFTRTRLQPPTAPCALVPPSLTQMDRTEFSTWTYLLACRMRACYALSKLAEEDSTSRLNVMLGCDVIGAGLPSTETGAPLPRWSM